MIPINAVIDLTALNYDVDKHWSTALTQLLIDLDCFSLCFSLGLDLRHRGHSSRLCVRVAPT